MSAFSFQFPNGTEEGLRLAEAFNKNFPHCLGTIDGKHIVMQAQENSGSLLLITKQKKITKVTLPKSDNNN